MTRQEIADTNGVSGHNTKASGRSRLSQGETKRLKQEVANAHDALRSALESEEALKEQFQSANEEIFGE